MGLGVDAAEGSQAAGVAARLLAAPPAVGDPLFDQLPTCARFAAVGDCSKVRRRDAPPASPPCPLFVGSSLCV